VEEDEEDFYIDNANHGAQATTPEKQSNPKAPEPVDASDEEGEDSDSDIEIVTERKDGEEPPVAQLSKPTISASGVQADISSQAATFTTTTQLSEDATSRHDPHAQQLPVLKSGKSYPEVRTSTIEVNGNPTYAPIGKPITDIEIDADLAETEKPWRRPGADQSDYFNYGFDEFTWSTYCLRQKTMADALVEQKAENERFESMLGGGMMSGMGMPSATPTPAAMGAMPAMPGMPMPNAQDIQTLMMQAMEEQGISDPHQLDFNQFMNKLQGGSGGGMMSQQNIPSGPAAQHQGGYGGNWQQQQGFGRGGSKQGRRWQ